MLSQKHQLQKSPYPVVHLYKVRNARKFSYSVERYMLSKEMIAIKFRPEVTSKGRLGSIREHSELPYVMFWNVDLCFVIKQWAVHLCFICFCVCSISQLKRSKENRKGYKILGWMFANPVCYMFEFLAFFFYHVILFFLSLDALWRVLTFTYYCSLARPFGVGGNNRGDKKCRLQQETVWVGTWYQSALEKQQHLCTKTTIGFFLSSLSEGRMEEAAP